MNIVSIHQPHYLPWFGLLDKICKSDTFVVLDTVQYNKRSFQNRTWYSTPQGVKYVTCAINNKGFQQDTLEIRHCKLVDPTEPQKHFKTLYHRYGKTPGWKLKSAELEAVLTPSESLVEIATRTLEFTLKLFGATPKIHMASALAASGVKSELMLNITKAVGGDVYLSGTGAKDYMDDSLFEKAGVGVQYQAFKHPQYEQGLSLPFQDGCLAMEWFFLDPENARTSFQKQLTLGAQTPRCFNGDAV